ncbi:hypothetical protein TAL182_CH01067 [Rhizobium sp. TAL182]|nr:hypothetical protein TAL182_CH01067 [Rhizobium sp. TAL182]
MDSGEGTRARAWFWIPGSSPGMTESVVGVLAKRTGDALRVPRSRFASSRPARLVSPGTTSPPSAR